MKKLLLGLIFVATTVVAQVAVKVDDNGNILPTSVNGHVLNLPAGTTLNGQTIGGGGGSGDMVGSHNLSELTNTTIARQNLGVVIGTNVQAYSLSLANFAALNTTNKFYYLSAANVWTPVTVGSGMDFTGGVLTATGGGGGGLANIVDDLTPQLGGNLDMNGFNVGTVTPTEMNFVHGVTSALQTQLDGKQPLDSDLTYLAGFTPSADVKTILNAANNAAIKSALSLTSSDVGLGSVTNNAQTKESVVPNTAPSTGQLLIGGGAGAYAPVTMAGDATINSSGTLALAAGSVTLAKMGNMATSSLIYRKTVGTGVPEVNTLATLKTDLGLVGSNSGDQTITLTGDVTGGGTGTFATTLANANITPGTYGDATHYATVTTNAKGLVTASSQTVWPTFNQNTSGSAATLLNSHTIAITGDLAYTSGSFNGSANVTGAGTLATVNTNVGSFTSANITVNAKGLVTAAANGTGGTADVSSSATTNSDGDIAVFAADGDGKHIRVATGAEAFSYGTDPGHSFIPFWVTGGTTWGELLFSDDAALGTSATTVPSQRAVKEYVNTVVTSFSPGGANFTVQYNNAGSLDGITGTTTDGDILTLTDPVMNGVTYSGNISAPAWTTSGVRIKGTAATFTDTTSSGSVSNAYTNVFASNTIAATNTVTFGNYFGTYFAAPTAGTNVTLSNNYALGADSMGIGSGSQKVKVASTGQLTATSPSFGTGLDTSSATFALLNTTATTVNAFGAATALNIGTGAATILNLGGFTTAAELHFLEPSGSGTNFTAFKAQAQGSSITYTLPDTIGGAGTSLTDVAGNGVLSWVAPAGAGTVTATGGALSTNAVVLGAGGTDTKVSAGITTNGAAQITLGVNATTIGRVKMFGNTSGDATIQPAAIAGTSTAVTLPNASSTLPIFGQQITFLGPTGAHSVTLPDADFTVARTDAANTFTGVQTMTSPSFTTPVLGTPSSGILTNCTFPTLNQNTSGSAATLTTTRTIWGQNFNGSANVTGDLTAVGNVTGGASNMTITAGTGNSRTLSLQTTTSGGTATTFLSGSATQDTTLAGNLTLGAGTSGITGAAGNMTITSGTGNSRTMALRTTTSGGTATTALTLNADQTATFAAGVTAAGASTIGNNAMTAGTFEPGNTNDATIARVGANDISVEGNTIYRVGGTDVAVADGGTGLSSGTNGGILAYTGTGTLVSSGLLAANAIMVGGGVGVAPSTVTTGTNVLTALGVAVGSAGAVVTNGGVLGTPSSGSAANLTSFPTLNQSTTGSAATLTTSRNLWGVAFNGSAAIGGAIELGTAGTTDTTLDRNGAGVAQVEGVILTRTIASGTSALNTGAVASGACATLVTTTATGTATTDTINWTPNADISGVTGYAPVTTGALIIYPYPTTNNVNFNVCNPTSASITPGAVTLNWKVTR